MTTTTAETVDESAPKVRRLLQRQILPIDRDTDVFALYVDPEEPRLDADRYDIGGNRAAKDLNNAAIRQSTSTGRAVHPDQILSRTAFRVQRGPRGDRLAGGRLVELLGALVRADRLLVGIEHRVLGVDVQRHDVEVAVAGEDEALQDPANGLVTHRRLRT